MHIQFNSDSNIEGRDALFDKIRPGVEKALAHFAKDITRLEIHVSDVSADRSSDDDIRAVLEVRRQGKQPIAVTNAAANPRLAIIGAAEKAKRALDSDQGKARDRSRQ